MWIYKFFPALIFFSFALEVNAQDSLLSPELRQMHQHAKEYVAARNYKDAVVTYKQLLTLAPAQLYLAEELAGAYYISGDYTHAVEILQPFVDKQESTDKVFEILAQSQSALYYNKEAKATIKKGLLRYPASGRLYHIQGNILDKEKDMPSAIVSYINGIDKNPTYALNYKDAALAYLNTDAPLWGMLYGQTYLVLPHDSTDDTAIKTALHKGWKTFFDHIADKNDGTLMPFEQAITDIYKQLTPVISDGITTENLTMVQVRFLMEWNARYKETYPFALFGYQDSLIRNGLFDIYNEWVYGKAESKVQYEAWNKFHVGDMDKLAQWMAANPITLPADKYSLYQDRSSATMKRLFSKKKKR